MLHQQQKQQWVDMIRHFLVSFLKSNSPFAGRQAAADTQVYIIKNDSTAKNRQAPLLVSIKGIEQFADYKPHYTRERGGIAVNIDRDCH